MHAYDVPRRQSYPPIPSGRVAQDPSAGSSPTPIFDDLCAEYVRAFRTCPGDRSGEEELGFVPFSGSPHDTGSYGIGNYGTGTYATGSYDTGTFDTGTYDTGSYDTGTYDTGAYGTRHGTPQHATGQLTAQHGHTAPAAAVWQQVARQARGMHPVAALPPAPRRGL
ncbi:hypothetical protein ACIHAA_12580 [Streptomyces sp. NPDC052040]|uniref:hypothetical protein n=1 Tax=unclassified Streptomyces TaxID=2593676 RepID=UPI0037D48E1C